MCKYFKISRSGYYKWREKSKKCDKDEYLRDLIVKCQIKNRNCYGYRIVKIWLLREYGLTVNHKSVLQIMNKYSLLSEIRRKKYYKRYTQGVLRYKNILKRNFTAQMPNQKWTTDITYIKTDHGIIFLSVIKDLYDGYIVRYKMSKNNQTYSLVDKTIRSALAELKPTDKVILHSDQGNQYTSREYRKITEENNITPSMSKPGTPIDNSPVESFFSVLKSECLMHNNFDSFDSAIASIHDYIYYYNYERIQLRSGLTPFEIRSSFV